MRNRISIRILRCRRRRGVIFIWKIAERLIEGKSPKEGQAGQSSTSVSRKEEKQQPTMALDAGKVEAETSKKQCQC